MAYEPPNEQLAQEFTWPRVHTLCLDDMRISGYPDLARAFPSTRITFLRGLGIKQLLRSESFFARLESLEAKWPIIEAAVRAGAQLRHLAESSLQSSASTPMEKQQHIFPPTLQSLRLKTPYTAPDFFGHFPSITPALRFLYVDILVEVGWDMAPGLVSLHHVIHSPC